MQRADRRVQWRPEIVAVREFCPSPRSYFMPEHLAAALSAPASGGAEANANLLYDRPSGDAVAKADAVDKAGGVSAAFTAAARRRANEASAGHRRASPVAGDAAVGESAPGAGSVAAGSSTSRPWYGALQPHYFILDNADDNHPTDDDNRPQVEDAMPKVLDTLLRRAPRPARVALALEPEPSHAAPPISGPTQQAKRSCVSRPGLSTSGMQQLPPHTTPRASAHGSLVQLTTSAPGARTSPQSHPTPPPAQAESIDLPAGAAYAAPPPPLLSTTQRPQPPTSSEAAATTIGIASTSAPPASRKRRVIYDDDSDDSHADDDSSSDDDDNKPVNVKRRPLWWPPPVKEEDTRAMAALRRHAKYEAAKVVTIVGGKPEGESALPPSWVGKRGERARAIARERARAIHAFAGKVSCGRFVDKGGIVYEGELCTKCDKGFAKECLMRRFARETHAMAERSTPPRRADPGVRHIPYGAVIAMSAAEWHDDEGAPWRTWLGTYSGFRPEEPKYPYILTFSDRSSMMVDDEDLLLGYEMANHILKLSDGNPRVGQTMGPSQKLRPWGIKHDPPAA